uniref:HECT domain-containing protein n=1 Tax=Globodera rostochiensis TaxID=31243 RepID=A0A914GSS8_GLORO
MGRWSNTITMFARTFHEELTNRFGGDYSHSVLLNKTGVCSFSVRLLQFRKQMDKLKTVQTKDLIFSQMPREKYAMVQHTFRQLNQTYVKRLGSSSGGGTSLSNTPSQSQSGGAAVPAAAADQQQMMMLGMDQQRQAATTSPLLASHKVKVTFRDEPGEGTGVARHFYAALADAFTSMKHLPQLDNVNEDGTNRPLATAADSSTSSGSNAATTQGTPHLSRSTPIKSSSDVAKSVAQKARAIAAKVGGTSRGETAAGGGTGAAAATVPSLQQQISTDTQPLFYRTSKTGFFTPITGSNSAQRLNAFRNVGRLIGFCLQNTEIIPLPLCRHVLKYVLNRPLNWFDLAFFDPSLFDSLRSIVYNEENDEYHPSEFYEQLEMTFSVDLPAEEGGGHIELKPDGANIAVTRDNVLEYICLFVEHRLLGTHRPSLEAMRRGVFDVLPADALANLTSEDLRLILCGTQEFSIQHLQNFTKFLDESSASAEVLTKYKKTFWSVVNKLSSAEKQDLCFFWTGSPSLPSSEEGFRPLPTIMIRPADDQHLPTANTCISRLYLPIYSSKKLLREKLSLAIKARNFGFV